MKKKSLQVYTFSLYACFVEHYKKNIINPTMSIPFWHLIFFFHIYCNCWIDCAIILGWSIISLIRTKEVMEKKKKKKQRLEEKKTWISCKASHCSSLESLPHESVASCLRLLYFANCPKLIEAVWIRQKVHYPRGLKINLANSERSNSIGQVLNLLSRGY